MKTKIYRNQKDPRSFGLKFDDIQRTQVQLSAVGELEGEVVVTIARRNRDDFGDFNADPDYLKDYNANMNDVVRDLIGACDRDMKGNFDISALSGENSTKLHVCMRPGGACSFEELVRRIQAHF